MKTVMTTGHVDQKKRVKVSDNSNKGSNFFALDYCYAVLPVHFPDFFYETQVGEKDKVHVSTAYVL